ncbi:MAG: glycosyltransferase family 2 protein [Bacteroidota bacterium]
MTTPFSIVIICRNESDGIAQTLSGLQGLSDDIIVYDTGSTDGTQAIVRDWPVRLIEGEWKGFGPTKNTANALAIYDWILSLDADEVPDQTLRAELLNWSPASVNCVYNCSFLNYVGDQPVRFGEWGWDRHIRLFNRTKVLWDSEPVHEQLQFPVDVQIGRLRGKIRHRTVRDWADHRNKMDQYARLNAQKYFALGKAPPLWKLWLSPPFTFVHYYVLKLGFLDGAAGWQCAWLTARYTYWKYARLRQLYRA